MGRALIIKDADFSANNVGVVTFEGRELFETLLLHKWNLATDVVDSVGNADIVEFESGAISISDGLTVGVTQKIYADLTDYLDPDVDGITIAMKIYPVQWWPNDGTSRIVYCCLTTGLAYVGAGPELCLVSQNSNSPSIVLKTGGTDQVNIGGFTLNAWNTVILTANKTGIKYCVGRAVSAESAPNATSNPTQYTKLFLGASWSGTTVSDAHKIKDIRMYRKYMSNVEMQMLYDLMESL